MQKAIMTLVMLGLSTIAMADATINGSIGYRNDVTEVGTAERSTKDRLKAELIISSKVNDDVNAYIGARVGTVNSGWDDFGGSADLKKVGLNLAYVEYAAVQNVKVRLGKFSQPWATSSSLFFDKDVKPEGLAVAYANKATGVFANASSVTITEGGATSDTSVTSVQAGLKRNVLGFAVTGAVGLQDYNNTGATKYSVQNAFLTIGSRVAHTPVSVFVDVIKNSKDNTEEDDGVAYGIKIGEAVEPTQWDVSYMYQKQDALAQYGLWNDSDIAGATGNYKSDVFQANYVVTKNWKASGKYFNTLRGASEEKYKRVQLDLMYTF